MRYRKEKDILGESDIPADSLWGIHTLRAFDNFRISGEKVPTRLIRALAMVKKACSQANLETGFLDKDKADAIIRACDEVIEGRHCEEFPLDALQGGAGTSTNMNINEVLANRASEILGGDKGAGALVHPLDDVNMHQSTNDVYPTALKLAVIEGLRELSAAVELLQGIFQKKEKEFADVIKTGRTEMREALPLTLGAEFSAFAGAIARDRWRVFKCEERIRQVNLGGTAVGTGLSAPRGYIFLVIEKLRNISGSGLTRGENTVDQTANNDSLVEVSGILQAHASTLIKVCGDLRLLNLLGEIKLEKVQTGSSIMPVKNNPVIPEAAIQAGILAKSYSSALFDAVSRSTLQISEFMPLISFSILKVIDMLKNTDEMLAKHLNGLRADRLKCEEYFNGNPLVITAFLPYIGYGRTEELIEEYTASKRTDLKSFLAEKLGQKMVGDVLSPEKLMSLGYREYEKNT
jgi:aspartate ammonia-lyase